MQKILVTEQSFRKIREANGLYVDKTKQIYDLFSWDTYFFIARPRRFGKSLLCSTLAELFAGNRELFKNTWIDKSDWNWEQYPVIHLDMTSAISSTGDSLEVRKKLMLALTLLAKKHAIDISLAIDPATALDLLIKGIHESLNKQVVLIIDEYDKPLLDAIDKTDKFLAIHDELRAFYSPLKSLAPVLKFVFITGVFKFAKTSIFSGFNNLKDITFSPKAATVCGYTEAEIRLSFADHLQALAKLYKQTPEEMMDRLRTQYNGYAFGLNLATEDLSAGIYNPYGLNYVFAEQQLLQKWFSSGSPTALIKKLAYNGFKDLEPSGLAIHFDTLDTSCSPEDLTTNALAHPDDNKIGSLTMLYYAGYLTMKGYRNRKVILSFPNEEVSYAFSQTLLPFILQKSILTINDLSDKMYDIFTHQRLNDLQDLFNDALAPVSYLTFKRPSKNSNTAIPQENLYHIAFYYLFIGSKLKTTLEDTTIRGRIDISVETPAVVYLFEFKMDDTAASAIAQIKERDYARKFKQTNKKIYAVGVSVSSKNRVVQELEYEPL